MAVTSARRARVFVAVGQGAWGAVQELRARREVVLVASPRHATVLLVAGRIPDAHREPLARVHDQLPHPRRTVGWRTDVVPLDVGDVRIAADDTADVVRVVTAGQRAVTAEPSSSEPDVLPDAEPNEWRGVGPHGQGGEGMMGGVPYGRPMAMTGPDRDGLALDRLELRVGPFVPAFPPGVVLDLVLQGEVIQSIEEHVDRPPSGDVVDPKRRRLRWLAHALHVHGLDPLAARAAALAGQEDPDRRALQDLRRSVIRSGLLWSLRDVGSIDGRGDCADRWRDRLEGLVGGDLDVRTVPAGVVDRLSGFTWQAAIATLVSVGWNEERSAAVVER